MDGPECGTPHGVPLDRLPGEKIESGNTEHSLRLNPLADALMILGYNLATPPIFARKITPFFDDTQNSDETVLLAVYNDLHDPFYYD